MVCESHSTKWSSAARLLRRRIGELVAALFAVAGHGDDRERGRTDGVNGSTNGQMPLAIQV